MKNVDLYAAGVVYLKRDLQVAMFSSLPELVTYFSYNVIFCMYLEKGGSVFPLMPNKGLNVCLYFSGNTLC